MLLQTNQPRWFETLQCNFTLVLPSCAQSNPPLYFLIKTYISISHRILVVPASFRSFSWIHENSSVVFCRCVCVRARARACFHRSPYLYNYTLFYHRTYVFNLSSLFLMSIWHRYFYFLCLLCKCTWDILGTNIFLKQSYSYVYRYYILNIDIYIMLYKRWYIW